MNYSPLYRLRAVHEYFEYQTAPLRCRIAPSGTALRQRRGLVLRQTAANEWTLLYDSDGAGMETGSDVLPLELELADPHFVLYTRWEEFRPDAAYGLELPVAEETIEAAQAIRKIADRRTPGTGFCLVEIRMTEELMQAARNGRPAGCTLLFRAPEYRWEFLLAPRGDELPERLSLEEAGGGIDFPPFEPAEVYGRKVLRTVSEQRIPMRMRYPYRLKVYAEAENGGRRQCLLKHVDLPKPGKFPDAGSDILRQVCNL